MLDVMVVGVYRPTDRTIPRWNDPTLEWLSESSQRTFGRWATARLLQRAAAGRAADLARVTHLDADDRSDRPLESDLTSCRITSRGGRGGCLRPHEPRRDSQPRSAHTGEPDGICADGKRRSWRLRCPDRASIVITDARHRAASLPRRGSAGADARLARVLSRVRKGGRAVAAAHRRFAS